ncbi:MAG: hypothetical protein Q9216_003533 [Gyalolechia sp. 2 TL-2023]
MSTNIHFLPTTSADSSPLPDLINRLTTYYNPSVLPRWSLRQSLFRSTPARPTANDEQKSSPRSLQIVSLPDYPNDSHVAITPSAPATPLDNTSNEPVATVVSIPSGPSTDEFIQLLTSKLGPLWQQRQLLTVVDGSTFEVGDIRIRAGELRQGLGGSQLVRGVVVEVTHKGRVDEKLDRTAGEKLIKAFWEELGMKGGREFTATGSERTGDGFEDILATPPESDTTNSDQSLSEDRGTAEAPLENLDQVLDYFEEDSDVSKFVALARLKAILDNKRELREDPEVITRCWAAVPARFLDRLLRAANYKADERVTDRTVLVRRITDRDYMIGYAVAIVHTFVNLLPEASRNDKKFARRIEGLLNALTISPPLPSDTQLQILRVLLTLASTHHGTAALLKVPDWTKFVPFIRDYEDGLKIFEYTCAIVALEAADITTQPLQLHETIYSLVNESPQPADSTPLFQCIANMIRFIPKETSTPPNWLAPVARLLLRSITASSFKSQENKRAIVHAGASLVRTYPKHFPIILFSSELRDGSGATSKPLCWLFVQDQLKDIQTWIPSLAGKPDSPECDRNSTRLADSYDILTAFMGFLVQMEDIRHDSDSDLQVFPNDPNLLCLVEEGLSSTCSLTIKHLCKSYDTATAGTSLIEGSTGVPVSSNTDLFHIRENRLILAQLRMLALWLREDRGEKIHEEAADMMVLLLGLYYPQDETRWPILAVLEQLILNESNIDSLLHNNGWETLVNDFSSIIHSPSAQVESFECLELIVDMLAPVANHIIKSGAASRYGMEFIGVVCTFDANGSRDVLEMKCAALFVAVHFYFKIPADVKGKRKALKPLLKVTRMLLAASGELEDATKNELEHSMEALTRVQENSAQMMVANLSLS